MKLANSLSLNMIDCFPANISVRETSVEEIKNIPMWESYIGHEDLANIISNYLGKKITTNRSSLKISPGESVVVAQYIGPRLPEGTTQLPDGAMIKFYLVTVQASI